MIRVLIADDQKILRESLKFIIIQDKNLDVVGCASDGREAYELCESLKPDIVLMDVKMPVCDGIESTKLIKSRFHQIKIIMLTTYGDDISISAALKNGAEGYLLKEIDPEDLIMAIKNTFKGFGIIYPGLFRNVTKKISTSLKKSSRENNKRTSQLTERDLKIIQLIVEGNDNNQIASALFLSKGTVKNLISLILEKLELRDRTQLAVFAVRENLV